MNRSNFHSIKNNPLIWLGVFLFLLLSGAGLLWSAMQHEDAEAGTFRIYAEATRGGAAIAYTGSSFLVSGTRYLVTNYHVVQGVDRIYVQYLAQDDNVASTPASLLWYSADRDLAILESGADLPGSPLRLADISEQDLQKRDLVTAIGFPGAAESIGQTIAGRDARDDLKNRIYLDTTVSTGTIQRFVQSTNRLMIQHSANVNSGNSGGPLLDECDRVIGVNTLSQYASIQGKDIFEALLGMRSELNFQTPGSLEFAVHIREAISALEEVPLPLRKSTGSCNFGLTGDELVPVQALAGMSVLALLMFGISLRSHPDAFRDAFKSRDSPMAIRTTLAGSSMLQSGDGDMAGISQPYYLRGTGGSTDVTLQPDVLSRVNGGLKIGRSRTQCDITINDDSVSRLHAKIDLDDLGRLGIVDFNSANGSFVNGNRISAENRTRIRSGDVLSIGAVKYILEVPVTNDAGVFSEPVYPVENWILSGFDRHGAVVQITIDRPSSLNSNEEFSEVARLGRGSQCDAIIKDDSVSRVHASIGFLTDEGIAVRDLHSSNGTFVDGMRLGDKPFAISSAKKIRFGDIELVISRQM